ncbi:unnamed protein product [Mytilus coruscus]|uniref:EGF-like domain-containing protein n=1 Tax=Mytilus coruscus TaxID=42192 RepID=A0A6J8AUD0_MYTCO|nr:unnamed protein product [Mytilus coruscus]
MSMVKWQHFMFRHLTSNPLNCNCSIYPFWSWLIERVTIGTSAKCGNGTFVISLRLVELEKCNPNSCQCFNGGTCVTRDNGPVDCDCTGYWTGEFCQESQCTSYDCGFGDCYIEPVNGTAQCVCDDIHVNYCTDGLKCSVAAFARTSCRLHDKYLKETEVELLSDCTKDISSHLKTNGLNSGYRSRYEGTITEGRLIASRVGIFSETSLEQMTACLFHRPSYIYAKFSGICQKCLEQYRGESHAVEVENDQKDTKTTEELFFSCTEDTHEVDQPYHYRTSSNLPVNLTEVERQVTLASYGYKSREVFLRSDNAGGYKCGQIWLVMNELSQQSGITIRRYDYSEPQSGKSYCDAKIAHMRGKMRLE